MSLIDVPRYGGQSGGYQNRPGNSTYGPGVPNAGGVPKGSVTAADIRALFASYQLYDDTAIAGATWMPTHESALQRINRLVGEINSGRKTFDEVRNSIAQLPHRAGNGVYTPPGTPQTGPNKGTTGPANPTDTQRDALTRIQAVFRQYDLDGLSDWAWQEIVNGTSVEGMMIDLYNQPVFQQRFHVIFDRQKAGLAPVSPQDVINYEDQWNQMARAAGLPQSMANRETAQRLMGANVSAAEAQERVQQGIVRMRQSDPTVKAAFQGYFGIAGDGALASLFIDPNMALPDLERMVNEAEVGGAGAMHGWGVTETMAERLARIGTTYDQAKQGFSQLDQQRSLFQQTISEQSPLTAETGIEAEFGLSGTAEARVKAVAERRQADFSGASAQQTDQSGIIGAGSARSI